MYSSSLRNGPKWFIKFKGRETACLRCQVASKTDKFTKFKEKKQTMYSSSLKSCPINLQNLRGS